MNMDELRNAEAKEELSNDKLTRKFKDLERRWHSYEKTKQNPTLKFSRLYFSADLDKTIKHYYYNNASPRQLMEYLQRSPPSIVQEYNEVFNDESTVGKVRRKRKLAGSMLKGRRLFEDYSECGITTSSSSSTSQVCDYDEVGCSFFLDLVNCNVEETESLISYACNVGNMESEKKVEEYCLCYGSCSGSGSSITSTQDIVEKESNQVDLGIGGNQRQDGIGGGGGYAGRKLRMVMKLCVVFAFMVSILGIMTGSFGGVDEEKVIFLVPT